MKRKIKILVTIIIAFLSSCTEPIDLKTGNSSPVIVIYGELTDMVKFQKIKISRSSPYFENEPNTGVSEAKVIVQSSDGEIFEFLENDSIRGLYLSQNTFGVRSGVTYDLSVIVDFDQNGIPEEYNASTTVLSAIIPDSLSLDPVELFGHKNYLLYVYWQDPPEKNYYLFTISYNDSLLSNQISRYMVTDDALFNGQFVPGDLYIFNDISEWEKDSKENREKSIYLHPGNVIGMEISLISDGFFDFIIQCQKERQGENPMFGGPASNIVTNVSNGGAGYFSGYCVKRKTIEYKESAW